MTALNRPERAPVYFQLIRPTVFAAGALALAGAALLAGAWVIHGRIDADQAAAARLALAKRAAFEAARIEARELQANTVEFAAIQAHGAVAPATRPNLFDSLEGALGTDTEHANSYGLRSRAQVSDLGAAGPKTFSIWRHVLEVDFRPRHEIHLLTMLDAMGRRLGPLSAIDSCTVKRSANQLEQAIEARCAFSTYTFEPNQPNAAAAPDAHNAQNAPTLPR